MGSSLFRHEAHRALRTAGGVLAETFRSWRRDKAQRMAAALAFYAAFSLAPLLVIAVSVAGLFVRRDAVQARVLEHLEGFTGEKGAEAVQSMMQGAARPSSNLLAAGLSLLLLLFGASRLFAQLRGALDSVWKVPPRAGLSLLPWIKTRFLSFGMVLGSGLLVLLSLLASAFLGAALSRVRSWMPGFEPLWRLLNEASGFLVTAAFFALLFKVLPARRVRWSDVWLGALGTTVLFTVGRLLLEIYLGWGLFHSVYGAAGSLVALLLWVYYSAQILLFGAEFTHVYALRFGSLARPGEGAS